MSMPAIKHPDPTPIPPSQKADTSKSSLWKFLRTEHPELAMAIQASMQMPDSWVTIDTLPLRTKQWLWQAIRQWHPELAKVLSEGPLAELKAAFGGSIYSLKSADVIRIVKAQQDSEQATSTTSIYKE